ncbi:MAG: DUF1491 family protein [Gluconacetobacter diazotrophicus]|nr:DUF1491 family protein [Gluconacetobacter diazotrophicus]
MPEPRLKAGLWVRALLRQAAAAGHTGAVLRRGDPDAGAVLVVLRDRAGGLAVLSQTRDAEGEPAWTRATGSVPVDQEAVDAYVARAERRDPDLWVVEFDGPNLSPPFPARLLD